MPGIITDHRSQMIMQMLIAIRHPVSTQFHVDISIKLGCGLQSKTNFNSELIDMSLLIWRYLCICKEFISDPKMMQK